MVNRPHKSLIDDLMGLGAFALESWAKGRVDEIKVLSDERKRRERKANSIDVEYKVLE